MVCHIFEATNKITFQINDEKTKRKRYLEKKSGTHVPMNRKETAMVKPGEHWLRLLINNVSKTYMLKYSRGVT